MSKFGEIFESLVINTIGRVHQFAIEFGPKLILSAVILIIGWICAVLLKKIVSKLLKALGFDVLSEKIGLKGFLERGGVRKNPSHVVGLAFYWLIIFSTLVMVFNTLKLELASQFINQVFFYIPKIIVVVILLALGIFLSRFVSEFAKTTAHLANIPMYALLGKLARYVIIGLTIMIILEYLGVATTVVVQYAVIIFGVVPLIACLVFLIGGRDMVSSMLAGRFLLKEYKEGDVVEFDSISGRIQSIDLITTKIKSNAEEIIIPNSELVKKVIKKRKTAEG